MSGKQLTVENWHQPDPTSAPFGRLSPIAGPVPMEGDDWARAFLAVELKGHVPTDVRDLFDVARGAMVFGWFYYPMFVLGEEQLHRVAEAAIKACYADLEGPRRRPTFAHAIDWLSDRGVIPDQDRPRWHDARRLRNAASHLSRASAMPPGQVRRMLDATAHDINRLFARAERFR